MNIFFMVSSMGAGGAERVATNLCNAWVGAGHMVTLLSTHMGSSSVSYQLSESVDLVFLSDRRQSIGIAAFEYISKLRAIRALIRARSPDVVVSFLPNVNVMAILATRFTGIPVIIGERTHPGNKLGSAGLEFACRFLYRFADILTVQTARAAATIGQVYSPAENLLTIPNPISDELSKIHRRLAREDDAQRRFVAIGRLSPEKCMADVIDAFSRCVLKYPEWILEIYGDGPLYNDLQAKVIALGMSSRIFLLGRVADPWAAMSRADAFVMASKFEGFPNALLEAMSIGLPAVASDCASGPREISDDGRVALLVPVGDVEAMSFNMERLMSDAALRESLGSSASAHVRATYGMDSIMALWDEAFGLVTRPTAR